MKHPLNSRLVGNRRNGLRQVVLCRDGVSLPRLNGLPLQVNVCALSLRNLPLLGVGLDTVDELLSALGVLDVLDADVDTLLDVSVADLLVDDDTDRRLGDVVDNASLAVVDLVGHTIYSSASELRE